MKQFIILSIVIVLSGCGAQTTIPTVDAKAALVEENKQRQLIIGDWLAGINRLERVGLPILEKGVGLCQHKRQTSTGMVLLNADVFPREFRKAAKSGYGFDERVQVSYVVPGSSADLSGLQAGDVMLRIGLLSVPTGKDAVDKTYKQLSAHLRLNQQASVVIERSDKEQTIVLSGNKACADQLIFSANDEINAYANGTDIVVNKGLIDFTQSDQELALVISHELAHNVMRHSEQKKQSSMWGELLGSAIDLASVLGGVYTSDSFSTVGSQVGARAYSIEFEQEADYVGLYLMKLSGYSIDNAADFWRRMAIKNNQLLTLKSTHPTSVERFIAIEKTLQEIQDKEAQGVELKPNYQN